MSKLFTYATIEDKGDIMGKKARKLRSPKYKAKAAAFRESVAKLNGRQVIDMGIEEETEESTIAITNEEPKEESIVKAPTPEPVIAKTVPNALKQATTTDTVKQPVKSETPPAIIKKPATKNTTTTRKRKTTKTKAVS